MYTVYFKAYICCQPAFGLRLGCGRYLVLAWSMHELVGGRGCYAPPQTITVTSTVQLLCSLGLGQD